MVDTGHHAPGVNIEFIVAHAAARLDKLGGFDFNSRFYADDDLMVGAADPFQLFRIMHEVVRGGGLSPAAGVAFMLDQCHNIEPKIPAQIRSVMNVQEAVAKALLVDADALRPRSSPATCSRERRADGRLQHRRPAAARGAAPGDGAGPRPGQGVPGLRVRGENHRRHGSAATPPAGERDWRDDDLPGPAAAAVAALLARSNRLGSDPRNTNYAGGNTSAKGTETDPVTGQPTRAAVGEGLGR